MKRINSGLTIYAAVCGNPSRMRFLQALIVILGWVDQGFLSSRNLLLKNLRLRVADEMIVRLDNADMAQTLAGPFAD